MAGGGARQRLAELRMPSYSPPFALWLVIGTAYYAICFIVLRYLLGTTTSPSVIASLCLLSVVLAANALWSVPFFRWRDLRISFLTFIPYALVVFALVTLLVPTYPFGAALFLCYGCYLIYATWWGYRLWRLNEPRT